MPFSHPVLTYVAAGLKQLDLRVGKPMLVGEVYMGRQPGMSIPFRVLEARTYASVLDVYNAVSKAGDLLALFPLQLQRHYQISVTDAASAAQMFNRIRRRPPPMVPLTLYRVAPLADALVTSDADVEATDHYGRARTSLISDADLASIQQLRHEQASSATPPSTAPLPSGDDGPRFACASQRVSLLVCSSQSGLPHVLCRRLGDELRPPCNTRPCLRPLGEWPTL